MDRDYLEVETPVRLFAPALELHIDAEPAGDRYLRTSPEMHMKRLLAAGAGRIFQMGPCFRKGERGRFHHPEYTMLEWYRAGVDYASVLEETRDLLCAVTRETRGDTRFEFAGRMVDVGGGWFETTVSEAFRGAAGWDPLTAYDADRFDLDLVEKVEPSFPANRPVVLKDYPVEAAALARCRTGPPPAAERWELYVAGLELANAFSELIDADEQRRRFDACAEQRAAMGKDVYPVDEAFLSALSDMPPAAGVALGIDRLVMLLADAESIDEVQAFSE